MVCRESPASNRLQLQRELPLHEKNRTGIKSLVGGGGGGVGGVGGGVVVVVAVAAVSST